MKAADAFSAQGIEVEIIDPRGVRPLDMPAIIASVKRTGRLVVVHEAPAPGNVASEVSAFVAENAIEYLAAPIKRVCAADVPIPQSTRLEQMAIPSIEAITAAIRSTLN